MEQLAESSAYDKVLQRLDNVFQYETMTELPADFEAFFVKLQRRVGQTVQEYQAEFDHVERRLISVHKIQLPEKIRAWWFLRRSGLKKEQRQLVLTQLGEANLTLTKTMSAMNCIIGQDAKMDAPRWNRGSASSSGYKDGAYHVDDGHEDWSWEDEGEGVLWFSSQVVEIVVRQRGRASPSPRANQKEARMERKGRDLRRDQLKQEQKMLLEEAFA